MAVNVYGKMMRGTLNVYCPKCLTLQPIATEDGWVIDLDGNVYPDFVCLEPERECMFAGPIRVANMIVDEEDE